MAPAPNPGPSAAVTAAGLASVGIWRLLAVAAPHLAALAVMFQTETDFSSRAGFLLSWGILNFFFIALLRRPALSGALSLTLVVVLVLLSRLKHDIVQMTANFVDLMVIDRDTAAFLFTIFPNLRWSVIGAALVTVPLMYALWWLDPFRIRRLPAVACMLACLAALVGYAIAWPDEAWRGYYDDGYLSKFARSGVTAVSDFINYGFMESDAVAAEHLVAAEFGQQRWRVRQTVEEFDRSYAADRPLQDSAYRANAPTITERYPRVADLLDRIAHFRAEVFGALLGGSEEIEARRTRAVRLREVARRYGIPTEPIDAR